MQFNINPDQSLISKIKQIKNAYYAGFILRAILTPILILLVFCVISSLFLQNFEFKNKNIFLGFLAMFIWFIALYLFIKKLSKIPNENTILKEFEAINSILVDAPLSEFHNINSINNNAFWKLHRDKITNYKIPKINFLKLFSNNDKIKFIAIIFLIFTILINEKISFSAVTFDFSNKEIVQNIEIYAISPNYLGGEKIAILQNQSNILPKNSEITIKIISDKKKNNIKYASKNYIFEDLQANEKFVKFFATKSANININIGNKSAKYKIKISQDKKPKIIGQLKINSVGNDNIALKFKAFDDFGLKSAYLKISGKIISNQSNHKIVEFIPIPIEKIKNNENSDVLLEIGQSALGGTRIKAQLILIDHVDNNAFSFPIYFNLQKAQFNNDIAQALYELRLGLIRENKEYLPHSLIKQSFFAENLFQEFKFQNIEPLDFAPKSIRNIYDVLKIYSENYEILGLDALSKLGIINAIAIIETAHSTYEAKQANHILMDIIKRLSSFEKDPKSRINDAIEKLKSAISQNLDEQQIEELKQELKQAIKDHIENLRNQSHESGDMEVEDKNSINGKDLSKMLDNINRGQNNIDELQKLDELNQTLQNLKLENNGEGTPQNGQNLSDLVDELQNNFDKTQNSNEEELKNRALENRELAQKLENSNKENDENINQAIKNLREAAKALENNDKESAQNAQKSALESLLNKLKNNETKDNSDPLGRALPTPSKNNGENGDNNEIPNKLDEKKSRDILIQLRQKLNDGTITKEERQYYEYLLQEK